MPADASLVVFGSLARGEWTSGSDLDWTLLVDGQVSPGHYDAVLAAQQALASKQPGTTGTFGGLAFSHDLVHLIGGQDDTNRNLTLRMLLLLESVALGNGEAHERVVKALLERYLVHPSLFSPAVTPRFLLNDLVRYWRTLGVDFADKFHDQAGKKAVLRNVKLRFSRKLIFAAGLYVCLDWYQKTEGGQPEGGSAQIISHFRRLVDASPLEVIAGACVELGAPGDIVGRIFDSYNLFLRYLGNEEIRGALETMRPGDASNDPYFSRLRKASHRFQAGLLSLLTLGGLKAQVRKYAIF